MKVSLFALGVAAVTAVAQPALVRAQMARSAPVATKPLVQVPTAHRLVLPPPPPPAPPPGISVQMQTSSTLSTGVGGLNSPPFSLGMASNFSLETTAPPSAPNQLYGNGSIQFVPGNDLALWLDQCATMHVRPTLMITNASPQGTVVYTLRDVMPATSQAGAAISESFQYKTIEWTFTYANGQPPATGAFTFGGTRPTH